MGQRKLYLKYYMDYYHYMWRPRLIAGILVCLAMYLFCEYVQELLVVCANEWWLEDGVVTCVVMKNEQPAVDLV
jgi:hypothetical protein